MHEYRGFFLLIHKVEGSQSPIRDGIYVPVLAF